MKKRKVLNGNNLPSRLPIPGTALWITVLHYWKAPEWLWGVFGIVFLILWGWAIYATCTEERIDLLNNDPKDEKL